MRKILFVAYSLTGGGAEKALVNLLNMFDYNKYEVHLQLFENRGINLEFLPQTVKLLPQLKHSDCYLLMNKLTFIKGCIRHLRIDILFKRAYYAFLTVIKGDRSQRYKTLCAWHAIKKEFKFETEYDIAVAYLQGITTYYTVDCIHAKKKFAWMHTDFSKIKYIREEETYFNQLCGLVTISNRCFDELKRAFPSLNNIKLLHNLNPPKMIYSLANQGSMNEFDLSTPVVLSIGRLNKLKGFDLAIEAAYMMKERGLKFKWYIIGVGEQEKMLRTLINDKGLVDCFFLLGAKLNPYPYIKMATVIAQTSRYEGKSIVIDEAKILKKPILVTNYNSVEDQVTHDKNGYIVDMTPKSIADGLSLLLNAPELRKELSSGCLDMEEEQNYWLNKHYKLFEGCQEI